MSGYLTCLPSHTGRLREWKRGIDAKKSAAPARLHQILAKIWE